MDPEKTTDLSQVTDKLYHIMFSQLLNIYISSHLVKVLVLSVDIGFDNIEWFQNGKQKLNTQYDILV